MSMEAHSRRDLGTNSTRCSWRTASATTRSEATAAPRHAGGRGRDASGEIGRDAVDAYGLPRCLSRPAASRRRAAHRVAPAVRDAANGDQFLDECGSATASTGARSRRREERLTFRAPRRARSCDRPRCDAIGGGARVVVGGRLRPGSPSTPWDRPLTERHRNRTVPGRGDRPLATQAADVDEEIPAL